MEHYWLQALTLKLCVINGEHSTRTHLHQSTYLSPSIHPNDATGSLMGSSQENRFLTDLVRIDECTRLNVEEMKIAIFGNQVDNSIPGANLW